MKSRPVIQRVQYGNTKLRRPFRRSDHEVHIPSPSRYGEGMTYSSEISSRRIGLWSFVQFLGTRLSYGPKNFVPLRSGFERVSSHREYPLVTGQMYTALNLSRHLTYRPFIRAKTIVPRSQNSEHIGRFVHGNHRLQLDEDTSTCIFGLSGNELNAVAQMELDSFYVWNVTTSCQSSWMNHIGLESILNIHIKCMTAFQGRSCRPRRASPFKVRDNSRLLLRKLYDRSVWL